MRYLPWGRFFHTRRPTFTVITDWKLIVAFIFLVPRRGPRNLRVFGETTNSLSVAWDHADGPVQQYRIIYSPTVGDPIDEYVSLILIHMSILFCSLLPVEGWTSAFLLRKSCDHSCTLVSRETVTFCVTFSDVTWSSCLCLAWPPPPQAISVFGLISFLKTGWKIVLSNINAYIFILSWIFQIFR